MPSALVRKSHRGCTSLHLAAWLLLAGCSDGSAPKSAASPSIVLTPRTLSIPTGTVGQFRAVVFERPGQTFGGTVQWSTSDQSIATVTSGGAVLGVSAGEATITVTALGVTEKASVRVTGVKGELALEAVHFTQAIQNASGTLPIVAGQPTVANVFVVAAPKVIAAEVVLSLFRGLTRVYTDTATTRFLRTTSDPGAPNVQFLLPGNFIDPAVRWEVELDPRRQEADGDRSDNRLPSGGAAPLNVVALSPFRLHLVPIFLFLHRDGPGNVTTANADDYLVGVRSMLPVGSIVSTVAPTYTITASFGNSEAAGDEFFWNGALQELDIARVSDPQASSHYWYGVVRPPAFTQLAIAGGAAYVPQSPDAVGPGTRTGMGIHVGWAENAAAHREILAHELGHLLGRLHAPSCDARLPTDAAFPGPGLIGVDGTDVYSWASGLQELAPTVRAQSGDVMGYCSPHWVSPYTYDAILRWRQADAGVVAGANFASTRGNRALIIAGLVDSMQRVEIRHALVTDTYVPHENSTNGVAINLRDGAGRSLYTGKAALAVRDHGSTVRSFLAIVPVGAFSSSDLREIVVSTASASARLRVAPTTRPAVVQSVARSGGLVEYSWDSDLFPSAIVRESGSGSVVAIGSLGRVVVQSPSAGVQIELSDGTSSQRARVRSNRE